MEDFSDFIKDYTFDFEESQIAYEPLKDRSSSRLLLVRKNPTRGMPQFEDLNFKDLAEIIDSEPELKKMLWVRNRSKVFWARIFARRLSGSRHEILFIKKTKDLTSTKSMWDVLIKHSAKMKFPENLLIETHEMSNANEVGTFKLVATGPNTVELENAEILFEKYGSVPLPPYIKREANFEDRKQYQTIWARGEAKSAAAPTASLHFDDAIWESILNKGVRSADVYLHVGLGTFEPMRVDRLSEHSLHAEDYELEPSVLAQIEKAPSGCLAVGTTACRLIESIAREPGLNGSTALFIRPGFEFLRTRALLTNFHLPESTLFVLVSVFAGSLTLAKEAYSHALKRGYRLFSYGDASLWL